MTYTPTDAYTFRTAQGTRSEKLADEFKALHDGGVKLVSMALTAGAADSIAFAWQNPENTAILIQRILVDITTAGGSASSVMDIGPTTSATGTAKTLMEGLDLNTTGLFDNIDDQGTGGAATARLDENGGTTDYVTGKILDANATSLAGNVYIEYVKV